MTLSEIKAALPKYIYLVPGVHKWREGDERAFHSEYGVYFSDDIKCTIGSVIPKWIDALDLEVVARRPIPDEVLENQAFWVLWNKLAIIPPRLNLDRWELHIAHYDRNIVISFNEGFEYEAGQTGLFELHQLNGFESEKKARAAIPLLGEQWNIIAQMSAGDLYSKWLMEQIQ